MTTLFTALSTIPDTRTGNRLTYPLDYVLLVVFCGVMSGFNSWYEMELYAKNNARDLEKLYKAITSKELTSYTPSHDTFAYIFQRISPIAFQGAFKSWLTAVFETMGQHIAIDGKTMRGVKRLELDADCHTVSAYIQGLRATLDQVFISNKSNEINAIKDLLELIDIEGSIITIDAIGTQKTIAKKIVDGKGDYVLNVKSNQPGTLLELEEHFKPAYKKDLVVNQSIDQGHGRVETRTMESLVEIKRFKELELYKDLDKWADIESIHKLTRVRYDKAKGIESTETSYYISSLNDPKRVFEVIRQHWSVENNLHYCLDVIMSEDLSAKRKDNEAQNWNIINKIALFFLEKQKTKTGNALKSLRKLNAGKKPSQIINFNYL